MILSICCWILFVSILLSIFESIFKRNFVYFSWGVFIWFRYQGYDNLIGWVRMCSLLFNFWKSLRRISVSCLNVWHLNLFTSQVIQSRDFFVRRFLITDSISLLFIGLFRFSNIFMFCISINLSILPRLSSLSLFFFFFFGIELFAVFLQFFLFL